MDISRRAFLKGVAATAACAAATSVIGPAAIADGAETAAAPVSADSYFGKWNFEIAPPPIPDDQIAETVTHEVIVVGAGTAGLVAANSALDEGVDVCLVTASSKPIYRGGSNHAVYSKAKERLGLEPDDLTLYEREMINNGMCVDQRKWYNFYNHSPEAMDWLIDIMEDKGYEVGLETPTPFLKDGNYFNFVGAHGFMTPEAHSMGMNQQFVVDELADRLAVAGKPVIFKNIARQLVREDDNKGRVTAVICEREDGSYVKYVGTKAIVLATGDFSTNKDMMAKYAPFSLPCVDPAKFEETPNYDRCFDYNGIYPGDGQKMGLWIGAAWQKVWPCCPMGGGVNPGPMNSDMIFSGLRVDRNGERFMNEYGVRDMGSYVNRIQPGGQVFALWNDDYADKLPFDWMASGTPYGEEPATQDREDVKAGWKKQAEQGQIVSGDTIEEVIEKLGLPASTIETVKRYNELCAKGNDEDFHKDPSLMISLENGPFYGQMGNQTLFLTVLGGLRTNSNMQVCDENDDPIPGLYNVGTMVGDMFNVNYTFQIPGFNLGATCICFGYLAGKYIAANE